jgi:hypothetical protein
MKEFTNVVESALSLRLCYRLSQILM